MHMADIFALHCIRITCEVSVLRRQVCSCVGALAPGVHDALHIRSAFRWSRAAVLDRAASFGMLVLCMCMYTRCFRRQGSIIFANPCFASVRLRQVFMMLVFVVLAVQIRSVSRGA